MSGDLEQGRPDHGGQGARESGDTRGTAAHHLNPHNAQTQGNGNGVSPPAGPSNGAPESDDARLARKCVERFSKARANDRSAWFRVGLALWGVSPSLLDAWVAWSRTREKHRDGECERLWSEFKPASNGKGYTIASLIFWAREDSGDPSFGKRGSR